MRNEEILPFDREFLKNQAEISGFALDKEKLDKFEIYYNVLDEYNQKINLTAVTSPEGVAVTHFVDSMTLLYADIAENAKIADIGAGAGFPSVPALIMRRDLDVTLIDSLNKRITFLEYLSESLNLPFRAIHARAEEAGRQKELREKFDVVCARGVARLNLLCEYCLPLAKVGGKMVALKGFEIEQELDQAKRAVKELGGRLCEVKKFELPDGSKRSIVIIEKCSTVSDKYPRASAKIAKNPLV